MKKVRLGGNIAGLIMPGSGFIADLVTEGATHIIEGQIENSISTKNYDWYYAMQDIITSK